MMEVITWMGIAFCLSQSAMFSGLNLAFFSLSRLRLEVAAGQGSMPAQAVLAMRNDANYLLVTILWGNVGINVLLTLLSDSIMTGVTSFLFSTVAITLFGEIAPQAYFSRNALKMASMLSPVLRIYQILLWPVARPTALLLDGWLGREGIGYFREQEIRSIIQKHIEADEADVDHVEGVGALNFLAIDDLPVCQEGEIIHPDSIIEMPVEVDLPVFPSQDSPDHAQFVSRIHASGHAWAIFTDSIGNPLLAMDTDGFLRSLFLDKEKTNPYQFCHRPIVFTDNQSTVADIIIAMKGSCSSGGRSCDPIENDICLVWTDQKRIITGADILGRLLKGVVLHAS